MLSFVVFFFLKELPLFSMSFCWSPSKFLFSPAIFQISHLAYRSFTLLVLCLHTYISLLSPFPFPFKYFSSTLYTIPFFVRPNSASSAYPFLASPSVHKFSLIQHFPLSFHIIHLLSPSSPASPSPPNSLFTIQLSIGFLFLTFLFPSSSFIFSFPSSFWDDM